MLLEADVGGRRVKFECEDSLVSAWVCRSILEDRTYPALPFLDDVRVILDVGANCGAAAVHFALRHPRAEVHAFEPAAGPLAYARRNAAAHPSIMVHGFGLSESDAEVDLYHGDASILGSVVRPSSVGTSERVRLRRGEAWAREAGIDRVDVLKVDVEGAETQVLEGLGELVAGAQVIYLEYDSRGARRDAEARLAATHELYFASHLFLDQGEIIYLARSLCDRAEAVEELRAIMRRLVAALSEGG